MERVAEMIRISLSSQRMETYPVNPFEAILSEGC